METIDLASIMKAEGGLKRGARLTVQNHRARLADLTVLNRFAICHCMKSLCELSCEFKQKFRRKVEQEFQPEFKHELQQEFKHDFGKEVLHVTR